MALRWVSVDANLRNHPKAIHLTKLLGVPRAHGYLVDLWCWATQNAPSGLISGAAARLVLEVAAGWDGTPEALTNALIQSGWVDETEDGLALHDWKDHAGAHIAKAEKDRKRMRDQRKKIATKFSGKRSRTVREQSPNVHEQNGTEANEPANTKTNTNPNRNPNPNPNEEDGRPPLELRGEPEPKKRKPSEAELFWEWGQEQRKKHRGLVREGDGPKDIAQLRTWFKRALEELGSPERMDQAFARYLLKPIDDYWSSRGYPFNGFMSDTGWRKYAPPSDREAA